MNIEQITDRYLDKLYKIDHLHDFMWKKKELVDFARFVLESVISDMKRYLEPATSTRGQGGLPLHGSVKDWEFCMTKDGFESFCNYIRHNAGLEKK